MNKPQWAINLRKARKIAKLTQEEIATKIYKSQEAYSSYERGICEPDLATWILICEVIEVYDLLRFINTDYYSETKAA